MLRESVAENRTIHLEYFIAINAVMKNDLSNKPERKIVVVALQTFI